MWLYQNQELTEVPVGVVSFVYLITNKISGKKYVGKKGFYSTRTKTIKGKKKKVKTESDWQKYYGSNAALVADVELHGAKNFKREILHICVGAGVASYLEAKEQFERDVILRDDFYNGWIAVKVTRMHVTKIRKTPI